MRTAILPAQITTVEDRIAGNLSLTQLILFIITIFSSALVYFVFPPINRLVIYKAVVCFLVSTVFISMAIRINGKLLVESAVVRLRYSSRPRIYVYTKNTKSRALQENMDFEKKESIFTPQKDAPRAHKLKPAQLVRIDGLVKKEKLKPTFKPNKHGGLNVSLFRA